MARTKRTRTDLVTHVQGRLRRQPDSEAATGLLAAFRDPELLDMKIIVRATENAPQDGHPLRFNSSLLAAYSPVLRRRMAKNGVGSDCGFFFRPYEERVLTITHADRKHVEMMLNYMQGWDVQFGLDEATEIWRLGDFYEVPDMCAAAQALWFSVLNANNCCELLSFARQYEIKGLVDRCFDLLILRFDDVAMMSGEHFQTLSAEVIGYVAGLDSLVVDSEYRLLQHIFGWFKHDPSPRRDALVQILRDLIRHDRLLSDDCEPVSGDTYYCSIHTTQKARRIAILLNRMRQWIVHGAYGIKHDGPNDPHGITYDEEAETLSKEEWIAKRAEAQAFAETVETLMRPLLLAAPYAVDLDLNGRYDSFLASSPRQYYWGQLAMYNAPGATGENAPFDPRGEHIALGGNLVCSIGRNQFSTVRLKQLVVSSRHAVVSAKVEWDIPGIFHLKQTAVGTSNVLRSTAYEIPGLTCKHDRENSTATLVTYLHDGSMNGCWLNGVKLNKGATVPLPYGAKIGLCAPFNNDEEEAQASNTGAAIPPRMRFMAPHTRPANADGTDFSESEDGDELEGESQEF